MLRSTHETTVKEVLSLPTAPFAEHEVDAYLTAFCRRLHSVELSRDRVGNIRVRYRHGAQRPRRPVCLAAHLDHPGFVAQKMIRPGRLRAAWHGGVRPEYFREAPVRFYHDETWVRGRVRSCRTTGRAAAKRVESAVIDVPTAVRPGAPGMWDFPDARVRGNRITARATDDLAGVAAMLCCLETLCRCRVPTEAYFLFTRAEEVGFAGALAACRQRFIPRRCAVVAVENSAELPHARMGEGPILRVGDKASTFTSAVTRFCGRIAANLAKRDRRFAYQRRLMDGGTCESTVYCERGYDAGGICIALGHYHNMNRRTGRLAGEYVDRRDLANMIKWFVALAAAVPGYTGTDRTLRARLAKIERTYTPLLHRTRQPQQDG